MIWDVDGTWDAEMKSDNRHFINNLPGQVSAELVRALESYMVSQFLHPERGGNIIGTLFRYIVLSSEGSQPESSCNGLQIKIQKSVR